MTESKYYPYALWVEAMTNARAVMLIIVDGDNGHGCAVRGDKEALKLLAAGLPELQQRLNADLAQP